jgi:pantetheine-phosphate adenylyltransferase
MRRALYPGSFDPVTNAHLDLIERGARIYDELIVAVAVNTGKNPLFSMAERVAMLEAEVGRFGSVRVASFRGLAVNFAKRSGAEVILRGIRSFSDFEYELQMAHTNRHFSDSVETLFMISGVEWSFVSARLLKEALVMGADIGHFVPAAVHAALREKLCRAEDGDPATG